ncbi:MAG: hypothetical protein EHM93_03010 [Bacteroidales bacterium]|nr:MAG: hypothetical protein EHM93_03010 [Bacteroidales bacterium]
MIDNKEIKVEDLLTSESFQCFFKKTNNTDIKYWKNWIKSNPSKIDIILEALEILNQIEFKKKYIAFDIIEKDLELLFKKISNKAIIIPNAHIDKKVKQNTYLLIKTAALIIYPLLIGSITLFFYLHKAQISENTFIDTYVPAGQKSELYFPDGTHVIINSNTRIKYPLNFSKRTVYLNGEAFFDVAKDNYSPFTVKMSTLELQVVGTKFNVKAYSVDDSIETTLIEGKVLIKRKSKKHILNSEIVLRQNQRASYNKVDGELKINRIEPILSTPWVKKAQILKRNSFNEQIKPLARRYNVEYNPNDSSSIRFNGAFWKKSLIRSGACT